MNPLLEKIVEEKLFREGETVLVAVSGGADSVALLDLLSRLPLKLAVAHLNHQIRGEAAEGDEAFVEELAASYRIPCYCRSADVPALAREGRMSLEEAAREARYLFLHETAEAIGATSIALAHHRDDQAETVLMRLLRGAGGSGLSAMSPQSGILKRPLLSVTRAELEEYLQGRGISYRTDETNFDTRLLRNSIRHELIPVLRQYNPEISARLADTARTLAADEELLRQVTEEAYARCAAVSGDAVQLDLKGLLPHPVALRMRLYRKALSQVRGLQRIGRVHLEAIDRLALGERPQARLSLPGGASVARSYCVLTVSPAPPPAAEYFEAEILAPGIHPLPLGGRLCVERIALPANLDSGSRTVVYLAPDAAPFPWLVRPFLPGDRFTPFGLSGKQKVKDFFINNKVELERRRRVPLLFSAGTLLWICGYRSSEEGRVTPRCDAVLRAEILDIIP